MITPGANSTLRWTVCLIRSGVVLFGLCLFCVAEEARDSRTEFTQRVWKKGQGLPDNKVQAILQTRDGYLWIGTGAGLARFDGTSFSVFNRINTPEMRTDSILSLAEDVDGDLWIGADLQLLRYRDGRFLEFSSPDESEKFRGTYILPGRTGGVWILSNLGLVQIRDGVRRRYRSGVDLSSGESTAMFEDSDGTLWVAVSNALHSIDPESGSPQTDAAYQKQIDRKAIGIQRDAENRLWILVCEPEDRAGRLYLQESGRWTAATESFEFHSDPIPQNLKLDGLVIFGFRADATECVGALVGERSCAMTCHKASRTMW